ncbi:hypothetical protein OHB26_02550 [Nocardia sp. NBC_01503]|uniref:hypothetical protein n=1 Tax=Nocardia sp. NBC_01503 TaxID=2975997 RepID=UPI002E7BEBAB|nr:hypothetical protein [Nocardia sp. NBC_01503]WTL33156.1 hypothetical protein OHB26_02550 [Nocardia sp. NBC_01503]
MPEKFPSPAGWTPPGAQFRSSGGFSRTIAGALIGLIVTPIGIGFAARGAAGTRQWVILGDLTDRLGATLQILVAAVLFLLVAALAAYSAAGTIVAGLVWGVLPGIIYLIFPDDTFRLIGDLPVSDDMHIALFQWLQTGFPLIVGILLIGAGGAATLRRR